MKRQSGFTLIELVMVIVILGVLAAVAIPKFVDLKGEAATAASQGIAGSLASASVINYAATQMGKGTPGLRSCDSFKTLIQGVWNGKYSLTGVDATGPGETTTCTVANTDGGTPKTFEAIGS
jgi:MSHA pilin protein MshA